MEIPMSIKSYPIQEEEFERTTRKLIFLLEASRKALEDSHEEDSNHNSIMAGMALDRWHTSHSEIQQFKERGRELAEIIGMKNAYRISNSVAREFS